MAAPATRLIHAEHVGSLLRPAYLLEARARHRAGELTDDALREVEDRAALDAIAVQRGAGIGVFTDGEVRRESWMAGIMESVGATVLEPQDELRRRIDEAARYVPLENLAISPQCGFASTERGNLLTVDDEKRKLELVADTARKVWG